MISRVFLPQVVHRFDEKKGVMVPSYDFSEAAKFGQLTPILDPDDDPMFLAKLTAKIKIALADFNEDDYLIAVGDPTVIAVCSGIILSRLPSMKMLKWDRKISTYMPLEIKP